MTTKEKQQEVKIIGLIWFLFIIVMCCVALTWRFIYVTKRAVDFGRNEQCVFTFLVNGVEENGECDYTIKQYK